MTTKDGISKFNQKELKAVMTALTHANIDLGYGWGGSYGGYDENSIPECKEATKEEERGRIGLVLLRRIISEHI